MKGVEKILVFRGSTPKVDSLDEAVEVGIAVPHHTEPGCLVWPRTSEELGKGEVVIDGQNVFTPPGADVLATDRIGLRDRMYEVEGDPGDYRMRGRKKGLLVVLKSVGT